MRCSRPRLLRESRVELGPAEHSLWHAEVVDCPTEDAMRERLGILTDQRREHLVMLAEAAGYGPGDRIEGAGPRMPSSIPSEMYGGAGGDLLGRMGIERSELAPRNGHGW